MDNNIIQFVLITLNVGKAANIGNWNGLSIKVPFTRLLYVTKGSAQITIRDKTYDMMPGYIYMIPAFTKHSCTCNGDFEHYYLHLYQENRQGTLLDDYDFPFEIQADTLTRPLFERICQINPEMVLPDSNTYKLEDSNTIIRSIAHNKGRTFSVRIETRGIIYQLISGFFYQAVPKTPVKDNRIDDIIKYIRKEIYNNIDMDHLVKMCCMSKDHFIRLFRKEVGETPVQYINHKKIEQAQLLLLTQDCSVKEIAYSLSFTDNSYFNRLFRKVTGISPSKYRESTKYPNSNIQNKVQ